MISIKGMGLIILPVALLLGLAVTAGLIALIIILSVKKKNKNK